ncbi:MAG: HlyC/CorC family transporter [Chloroflexaceae bacterium]|nr:HlyC/CorC family transporter [Chloroflexaceae bacterium]
MQPAPVIVAIATAMVLLNGLYVAAEFAAMHTSRTRIRQRATAGNWLAQLLEPVVTDTNQLDTYVAACQVGIVVSSLLLGFFGHALVASHLAPALSRITGIPEAMVGLLATVVIVLVLAIGQVVFGVLVPRSLSLRYSETIALLVILPMRWSIAFFRPIIALFTAAGALVLHLFRFQPSPHRGKIPSPEDIELIAAEGTRIGLIDAGERQLLHNVFRAGEITAAQVMVPRTRLTAAPVDTPVLNLLELATHSAHTRIPLYQETIDNIVGFVHLKDLFRLHVEHRDRVDTVLRRVAHVSEVKPALAVWNQLQQENSYVAIVLDEFGGTAGMITIADLIEEIFGELRDEFDSGPALIARGLDGCARMHGEVLITDVNEWFRLNLPDEEVNTLGGLVMTALGRLPQVGDEIAFGETRLRVEVVHGPTVVEVCLYPPSGSALHGPEGPGEEA